STRPTRPKARRLCDRLVYASGRRSSVEAEIGRPPTQQGRAFGRTNTVTIRLRAPSRQDNGRVSARPEVTGFRGNPVLRPCGAGMINAVGVRCLLCPL